MSAPDRIQALVTNILRDERRRGTTTKQTVVAKAMTRITAGGGPSHFGIGTAYVLHATALAVGAETDRQFKTALPVNVYSVPLGRAPPGLVQIMRKLPAWIATAQGPATPWVPSEKATRDDWMHNFELKRDIADRTMKAADLSRDVAEYLARHGVLSLAELLGI
jgi:hypothetical protein